MIYKTMGYIFSNIAKIHVENLGQSSYTPPLNLVTSVGVKYFLEHGKMTVFELIIKH